MDKLIIGGKHITKSMSLNEFAVNSFREVSTNNSKVYISNEPIDFVGYDFWVHLFVVEGNIQRVELYNASEQFNVDYSTMNKEIIEEQRKEDDRILNEAYGEPNVKRATGVEYNFQWGKIFSFYDNKSCEVGIVAIFN